MLRDQRLADNWALLHAASLAAASAAPLAVAFSLFPKPFLLSARRRQLGFLLRGLRRLAADAAARRLPFFFLTGTRFFLPPAPAFAFVAGENLFPEHEECVVTVHYVWLSGGPSEIPALVRRLGASTLVADFSPLRPVREALDAVVSELRHDTAGVAVHQVNFGTAGITGKLQSFSREFDGMT
jgi:deoxyribodipyrimidine photo-lyase